MKNCASVRVFRVVRGQWQPRNTRTTRTKTGTKAHRAEIFVDINHQESQLRQERNMPPRRGWILLGWFFYNDAAPTALKAFL
jgi:hypothetical protein